LVPVVARIFPSRATVLIIALAACGIALAYAAGSYLDKRRSNMKITAMQAGQEVGADPVTAAPEVVLARLKFLLLRDRLEEAQDLIDQAVAHVTPEARADLLYNLANARLRLAFIEIEKRELDRAIPLVRLAKEDYRMALEARHDNWDFKYNLDVAMRLVRDFPQPDIDDEEETDAEAKRVWTDVPGVPRGLP